MIRQSDGYCKFIHICPYNAAGSLAIAIRRARTASERPATAALLRRQPDAAARARWRRSIATSSWTENATTCAACSVYRSMRNDSTRDC